MPRSIYWQSCNNHLRPNITPNSLPSLLCSDCSRKRSVVVFCFKRQLHTKPQREQILTCCDRNTEAPKDLKIAKNLFCEYIRPNPGQQLFPQVSRQGNLTCRVDLISPAVLNSQKRVPHTAHPSIILTLLFHLHSHFPKLAFLTITFTAPFDFN